MLKQNALTKELNLLMKKRNAYSKRYMSKKELTPELASKFLQSFGQP